MKRCPWKGDQLEQQGGWVADSEFVDELHVGQELLVERVVGASPRRTARPGIPKATARCVLPTRPRSTRRSPRAVDRGRKPNRFERLEGNGRVWCPDPCTRGRGKAVCARRIRRTGGRRLARVAADGWRKVVHVQALAMEPNSRADCVDAPAPRQTAPSQHLADGDGPPWHTVASCGTGSRLGIEIFNGAFQRLQEQVGVVFEPRRCPTCHGSRRVSGPRR